jgi:hypothetical protein
MTSMAVSTTVSVLAVIGLAVGLIVLGVVIFLLSNVLAPLRSILRDLQSAKTAPMLERGVPGTDQLGTTRRLAESVPDLALAYLQKLSLPAKPAEPEPAMSAAAPAVSAAAPAQSVPDQGSATEPDDESLPAWKRYRG